MRDHECVFAHCLFPLVAQSQHEMTDIISFSSFFFFKYCITCAAVYSLHVIYSLKTGLQSDIMSFCLSFFAAHRSEKCKICVFSE